MTKAVKQNTWDVVCQKPSNKYLAGVGWARLGWAVQDCASVLEPGVLLHTPCRVTCLPSQLRGPKCFFLIHVSAPHGHDMILQEFTRWASNDMFLHLSAPQGHEARLQGFTRWALNGVCVCVCFYRYRP
jgi:hypothetical protein